MTFHKPIHGAGGGKGGGHTPDESPDSLFSDSVALLIDVVSEGEIEGWADPELPGTCIFFDDTPLQNADGSLNFEGVSYTLRTGTPDQAPVKGVEASSSEIGVNAQVKQAEPVVRSVASADVDAVVVKAHVPSLVNRQDDGDLRPTGVEFAIDIKAGDGPWDVAKEATISGKTLSGYVRAYRINLPSVRPVAIRMRRITADSADTSRANDLYFASFTEVIDAHLSYPDTAYVALAVRADAFGGRVPRRSYRLRGLKCLVPSNYDPETRTYDESAIWDGTFKRAFTSNPAFFSYSVYIDDRWGLGDRIDPTLVDKWRIYSIGKYCDELVDNGFGGQEPRFEINGVIDTRAAAYEVITNLSATFRGVTYWGAGAIVPVQDAPADPVKLVTNANVVDGSFSYSGTGLAARKTAAVASFRDVQDHYRIKPAAVHEDIAGIYRFGRRQVELALPFETRRGAAFRACRWEVETNLNATELVSYQAGFDHAAIRPGDRVLISDKNRLLLRAGGRILGVGADRRSVVLDAAIAVDEVEDLRLHVASAIGDFYTVEVDAPTGDAVTQLDLVDPLPADVVPGAVFMLNATGIAPRLFRVMSNTPQGHLFNVTAVLDDPDKFARVEADLSVEDPDPYIIPSRGAPNAPSGLQLSTFLRADVGSKSKMKFNFSWTRPPSDPVASYTVFFEEPGTARRKVADGIRDTSIDIEPEALDAGEYVATVHAVNQTGQSSPAARVVLDFTAPPYIVPDPPDVVGATAGFDTVEIRIAPHPASDFRAFRIYGATADDDTPVLIDETSQAVYARRPQAGDAVTRYKVTAYTFGDLESDIGQSSWIALRPTGVPIDGLQEAVTDAIESARQSATADKAGAEDAAAAALAAAGAAASSENDAAASRDNAAAAAIEAAASRSDAATAAIDAASSRSDAATAAIDAASSRSDAATAAIDAASSRSDAETAAIDAASSRSDAATAAINAASSRDDAATAAIDAAASTVDAVAAAIDAVASKGDASSSADLAGQRASAAEVAQQAAETAQSGAESARGAAVTAKNDAEGAASSASTSEALSSTARRRAEHAVTGNLFTEGSFDDLDHLNQTDISPGAIVNVPAPHPLGRTKALRQTSRDAYWPTAMIEGDIRGRTYRVTGWVYNEDATAQARVGFHIRYAEGGSTWPTVLVADPKQVGWVEFDVEMTISPNYGSCAGWRLFLQQNGSADTHTLLCYWTDLRWEDITNVVASQEAATASADSATTASSQADLAGLRASAAETAQQAAETARSGATSARDAAVTARQGAEDAEATATTQAGLATQAATDAGDAATASAGSASTASSSADLAGQRASAAEAAQQAAETARSGATSARDAAVTARQGAEDAEATATTQAGLATQAATDAGDAAKASAGSASTASSSADLAGQRASAAEAAQQAAETARSGATSARDAAVTARQGAEDAEATATTQAGLATQAATDAGNAATASAGSATTASSSADLAGQRASAAEVAQQAAETAQSGAESARGAAVTAKNDAEGAASSASTSEALSSTARRRAETAATGNLLTEGSFEDLDHLNQTDFTSGAIVNVPEAHPLGRSQALRQNYRDVYWPSMIDGDIRGRTYRITGWVYNEVSTAQARVGFQLRYAEGGSTWPTVQVANPGQVGWVAFDVELTINPSYSPCTGYRLFTQQNGHQGTHTLLCYWTDLRWEDITNVVASQEAATASAGSATTASSQADLAGQRASAAETAQQAAETARSGATSARDAAVTARQGAEDAQATATTQAGVATQAATDAGDAATASAGSATTASSQADLAGQRASAAEASRQAAETARSGATSARADAVSAASDADGARSSAVTQAGLASDAATAAGGSAQASADSATSAAAKAVQAGQAAASAQASSVIAARQLSAGMAAFPTFADWVGDDPKGWRVGHGGTSSSARSNNTRYGSALSLSTGSAPTGNAPYLDLRGTDWPNFALNPDDLATVLVRLEIQLLSGSWAGCVVRVEWRSANGNRYADLFLADLLDPTATGTQTVEVFLDRPADYVKGAPDYFRAVFYGNASIAGGGGQDQKTVLVHAFDVRGVTANSVAGITREVMARQDGWASSLLALGVEAGDASAGVRVFALDDLETPVSGIVFDGQYFTFRGDMTVFEGGSLQSDDWNPDAGTGFYIDKDGNAFFPQITVQAAQIEGLIEANQMYVNGLLSLDDVTAGFSIGKLTAFDDENDGLYMGRTLNEDGSIGFGLVAGVVGADGRDESLSFTKDGGSRLTNIKHFRDLSVRANPVQVTTNQTISLPPGTKMLDLIILAGGNGGNGGKDNADASGNYVGGRGGATYVEIYDGATYIATREALPPDPQTTADLSSTTGTDGQSTPYGVGGSRGIFYRDSEGTAVIRAALPATGHGAGGGGGYAGRRADAGYGGSASDVYSYTVDVSGLSNPKIKTLIGSGGAAGLGETPDDGDGGHGSAGLVIYTAHVSTPLRADVIPLEPTAWGTMSSHGPFPDLGAGFWLMSYDGEHIGLGDMEINNSGETLRPDYTSAVSFVSSKTPVVVPRYSARTIKYQFYKMGD